MIKTTRRPSLGSRTTVPWDVGGLTGGQNFRPRLTNDGGPVLGALGSLRQIPQRGPILARTCTR